VGIGAGGLLAPLFARGERWYRVLAPSGILMAISMFAVTAVPYLPGQVHRGVVIGALAFLGIAGGIFSIPVTSFIQVRPAAEVKGKMIASSNLADFAGILFSGVVFDIFVRLHIKPSNCFAIEAIILLAVAAWLIKALPKGNA
jgi:acyl-[acyl-carrier-protein]-phospholipid O-acyltransferase/long-chain-fatty-acid--[acyl-carrier-protein] ligase